MRNRINIFCIALFAIQVFFIFYFYFGAKGLNKDLQSYAISSNLLSLERDFELFKALDEHNLTVIKQNLEHNIMFHLTSIESVSLKNQTISINHTRLCKKYNEISNKFNRIYKNKYKKSINELNLLCK